MFEELIQSATRPFRATPDVAFYFPYEAAAGVRHTVVRALQRAEGPTIVLGGAGLGKSLLADLVAGDLSDRFDIVRLASASLCSRRALLQNILYELQLPYRNLSEGELRLSILDRLEPAPGRAPDGVLLVVDEADVLPVKLLEELRLINNYTRNGQPRTRLALFGNLRLEDTFADPALESFSQRLAARCYLQPMNKRDTAEFVRHQLRVAGANPGQVITQEGLDCVYAASEGVPRLANQIMDHALMLAIANCQSPISAALIEEAWADLQQLPAPWHAGHEAMNLPLAPLGTNVSTNVEFGSLNDDGEWGEEELSDVGRASLDLQSEEVTTNFFAAFRDLPAEEDTDHGAGLPGEESISEGNIDEEVEQDNAPEPTIADRPAVEAIAGGEAANCGHFDCQVDVPAAEIKIADSALETGLPPVSIAENYFAGRPTDLELLAFEDEQNQYDALGMWENDPPLIPLAAATGFGEVSRVEDALTLDFPGTGESQGKPKFGANLNVGEAASLFGSDFDEEVHIPERCSEPRRHSLEEIEFAPLVTVANENSRVFDSPIVEVVESLGAELVDVEPHVDRAASEASSTHELPEVALSADEVNDYVYRLQEYANCVVQSHLDVAVGEELLVGQPSGQDIRTVSPARSPAVDGWQVSTVEGDEQHALNIARDIEDLVSQLNFSAFSIEPYSVEQIAIDSAPNRARHEDGIRTGENQEVFMLHRPQELESRTVFSPTADDYDDDRNLLVIEEDVPAAVKPIESPAAVEKPSIKVSPYSQLFARLRK